MQHDEPYPLQYPLPHRAATMIDDMMDKYELSMKFLVIDSMDMMDKYEKSIKDQAALKQDSSKALQGKAPSGKI